VLDHHRRRILFRVATPHRGYALLWTYAA
jgi:hypothetical protein